MFAKFSFAPLHISYRILAESFYNVYKSNEKTYLELSRPFLYLEGNV